MGTEVHLGVGRVLASGKHVELIHHFHDVLAKGAEHQGEVSLLRKAQPCASDLSLSGLLHPIGDLQHHPPGSMRKGR